MPSATTRIQTLTIRLLLDAAASGTTASCRLLAIPTVTCRAFALAFHEGRAASRLRLQVASRVPCHRDGKQGMHRERSGCGLRPTPRRLAGPAGVCTHLETCAFHPFVCFPGLITYLRSRFFDSIFAQSSLRMNTLCPGALRGRALLPHLLRALCACQVHQGGRAGRCQSGRAPPAQFVIIIAIIMKLIMLLTNNLASNNTNIAARSGARPPRPRWFFRASCPLRAGMGTAAAEFHDSRSPWRPGSCVMPRAERAHAVRSSARVGSVDPEPGERQARVPPPPGGRQARLPADTGALPTRAHSCQGQVPPGRLLHGLLCRAWLRGRPPPHPAQFASALLSSSSPPLPPMLAQLSLRLPLLSASPPGLLPSLRFALYRMACTADYMPPAIRLVTCRTTMGSNVCCRDPDLNEKRLCDAA